MIIKNYLKNERKKKNSVNLKITKNYLFTAKYGFLGEKPLRNKGMKSKIDSK